MDSSRTPEEKPVLEPPCTPGAQGRDYARASMREEFLALFRPTDRSSPVPPGAEEAGSETRLPDTEPSMYLRRFLQLGAPSPELAPSGLADLDDRLAGGFGYGLHLVCGLPGVGITAFLESVAWEAISSKRPVLYYALRDGQLAVWERLISTIGYILGGATIPVDALRTHALSPPDLETLTRLDGALQSSVLPFLSLVGTIPAHTDTLSALIEDVRLRARELNERHGSIPLLLIDDLERLLPTTRVQSPPLLLSRLDSVLAADLMPGLLAVRAPGSSLGDLEKLPVQAVVALVPASTSPVDALERVDLQLLTNARTGWTGTLPLLLDRRSGFFAHPETGTECTSG